MSKKGAFLIIGVILYILTIRSALASENIKIYDVSFTEKATQGNNIDIYWSVDSVEAPKMSIMITFPDGNSKEYGYVDSKETLASTEMTRTTIQHFSFSDTFFVGDYDFRIVAVLPKEEETYSGKFRIEEPTFDSVKHVDTVSRITNQTTILVHGTEYQIGDIGKVWLQLLTSGNEYVSNATCFADIHKPDGSYLYTTQLMNYLSQGIYYYDSLIPDIVGVYPVVATCAYQTGMVNFNATNGQIIIGTQYLIQNYTATWLYDNVEWRIDEALDGIIYRLNFNMTFANITVPNFTSQMVIEWSGRWNGNGEDPVTVRVWNYSSSSWMALPSLIEPHGTTRYTLSNSITIPNYNLTAMGLIQNGVILLKFNDTSVADGTKSNIQNDQVLIKFVTLGTGIVSEIKGSSEIHVSSPTGRLYSIATFCGDTHPECAMFSSDVTLPEGVVIDNVTITNNYEIDINEIYEYETALGLDCTGVLSILRNSNGTIIDVYNLTTFNVGLKDNCILSLPIYFSSSESSVVYELTFDNYLKWEVEYYKNLVALYNMTIYDYCIPLGIAFNHTYVIPLATIPTQETMLTGCDRALDDLFWFYYYYELSQNISVVGEYESYLLEARWYFPRLREHYDMIQMYSVKNTQAIILSFLNSTWNYLTGTVFDFLFGINSTVNRIETTLNQINNSQINYTEQLNRIETKIDALNQTVLTNVTIYVSHTNCILGSTYFIDAQVTDYFNHVLTDSSVYCNIATNFWGNDTMSYVPSSGYFEYSHLCSPEGVVDWTIECNWIGA